jgi:hypothetical protein
MDNKILWNPFFMFPPLLGIMKLNNVLILQKVEKKGQWETFKDLPLSLF